MTQTVQISSGSRRASDGLIIGLVSAAHFVAHFYILILPPLFAFVRADYGVSYTELGLALTAFNVISAAGQTPAGFLADRIGAATILVAGLVLGGAAFMLAGMVDSFWFLVAMFGLAGLGNTVYHPADYAILAHHVSPSRLGPAFSIHTSGGMLGSAAASRPARSALWWRPSWCCSAMRSPTRFTPSTRRTPRRPAAGPSICCCRCRS
jgi:FSR family fosmidomycin resistance protein-like MFS transporter